jgi:hypothetical protein
MCQWKSKFIKVVLVVLLTMFPDIGVKDFDYKRLGEDFSRLAKEKGWL